MSGDAQVPELAWPLPGVGQGEVYFSGLRFPGCKMGWQSPLQSYQGVRFPDPRHAPVTGQDSAPPRLLCVVRWWCFSLKGSRFNIQIYLLEIY